MSEILLSQWVCMVKKINYKWNSNAQTVFFHWLFW